MALRSLYLSVCYCFCRARGTQSKLRTMQAPPLNVHKRPHQSHLCKEQEGESVCQHCCGRTQNGNTNEICNYNRNKHSFSHLDMQPTPPNAPLFHTQTHLDPEEENYSSSRPAFSSLHCSCNALTLSTPFTFPLPSSHSAHFLYTLLIRLDFPPALAARSNSARTASSDPWLRSRSM